MPPKNGRGRKPQAPQRALEPKREREKHAYRHPLQEHAKLEFLLALVRFFVNMFVFWLALGYFRLAQFCFLVSFLRARQTKNES